MSCPEETKTLISGAFVVISTRTFLLVLAVAPLGYFAPRWISLVLCALLVLSLIADWSRTRRVLPVS